MKRSLGLVITVLLLAMTAAPLNAATPRAGVKCSKAGETSTFSGKKFTCVKSGSRLIWNKGIAVKTVTKPENNPVLKPAEPTPSQAPIPVAPVLPKAPTSFDDLVENYQGISYAAWSKSREKILNSVKSPISINLMLGPSSELSYKTPELAFEYVSRMFAGFPSPKAINLIAFNYSDREWAINRIDSFIKPPGGSNFRPFFDVNCKTVETCYLANIYTDKDGVVYFPLAVPSKGDGSGPGTLEAHEFTHAIQEAVMQRVRPEPLVNPWPPTWYQEGHATFSEHAAIYHDSFPQFTTARKSISNSLYKSDKYNSAFIEKFYILEPGDRRYTGWEDRWNQYDLGAMFIEILVALKGPDSTMTMYSLAGKAVPFDQAFNQVYGIRFQEALPIMAKAIALQLGRS